MSGQRLVVNADDYGLTSGVSRAILRAHHEGILTSTSVLVLGSGFAASIGWLRDEGELGVGVHLALVGEDPPVLSAAEVPTLVDRRGRLARSWRQLLPRVATRRIDPDDIRRELAAQIDAVRREALRPDHLDSHQHVHMFPGIREVVVDLALQHDIPAVRVTRSAARGPVGRFVRHLAGVAESGLAADGLVHTGAFAGLDEAGRCDEHAIVAALDRLARSGVTTVELSGHPGEGGDPDLARYRWNYRWADEFAGLCSPAARAAVARHGFVPSTYAQLARVSA